MHQTGTREQVKVKVKTLDPGQIMTEFVELKPFLLLQREAQMGW